MACKLCAVSPRDRTLFLGLKFATLRKSLYLLSFSFQMYWFIVKYKIKVNVHVSTFHSIRYPSLRGGQRWHGMRDFLDTSTHTWHGDSNTGHAVTGAHPSKH